MPVKTELPQRQSQLCSGARRSFFCRMKSSGKAGPDTAQLVKVKKEPVDSPYHRKRRSGGSLCGSVQFIPVQFSSTHSTTASGDQVGFFVFQCSSVQEGARRSKVSPEAAIRWVSLFWVSSFQFSSVQIKSR